MIEFEETPGYEKLNKELKEEAERIFSRHNYTAADIQQATAFITPIITKIINEDTNKDISSEDFLKRHESELLMIVKELAKHLFEYVSKGV